MATLFFFGPVVAAALVFLAAMLAAALVVCIGALFANPEKTTV